MNNKTMADDLAKLYSSNNPIYVMNQKYNELQSDYRKIQNELKMAKYFKDKGVEVIAQFGDGLREVHNMVNSGADKELILKAIEKALDSTSILPNKR